MEYRNLGTSGLKVSTLCLGGWTFGEPDSGSIMHGAGTGEDTVFGLCDAAADAGINFIDTADVYGDDGLSERILGRWLQGSGKRNDTVVATKCRFRMSKSPNGTGASRRHIIEACEASLRRLQTDRIDLYQIHMQDMDVPEQETLRALDDLVRAGKILYIGCSNYAAYRLVHSQWVSRDQRLERFVSLQAQYSLIERSIEREAVPACREFGVGILPWSPLAGGFLTGKYHRDQGAPAGSRMSNAQWKSRFERFDNDRNWRIIAAVREVAASLDTTPAAVSLAWLLAQPQVTSVIFGARTSDQLADNVTGAQLTLPASALESLNEASSFDVGYPYAFMTNVMGRW